MRPALRNTDWAVATEPARRGTRVLPGLLIKPHANPEFPVQDIGIAVLFVLRRDRLPHRARLWRESAHKNRSYLLKN